MSESGPSVTNDVAEATEASLLERLRRGFAGRLEVARELGRGGMAIVFLAEDLRHHRPVALKVLRPELGAAFGADRSGARSASWPSCSTPISCRSSTRVRSTGCGTS